MIKHLGSSFILKNNLTDAFYIANLSVLKKKIAQWRCVLPNIDPFYAVKCNPDQTVLKTMVEEGLSFDCASKREIDTVTGMGVGPERIIFAHPVKKISDLKHSLVKGINYTTFDSISELEKIAEHAPSINCLMRLKVDNPTARVQLGLKYGVDEREYCELINAAKDLRVNIVGTSFHVGSASKEPSVFQKGIDYSRKVFEFARKKGFLMNILDIGGGFTKDTFYSSAAVLHTATRDGFWKESRIIAEPGRFFVEETFTFFVPVVGQRKRLEKMEYWVGDSLYGSFNCVLYDGQRPTFKVLRNPLLAKQKPIYKHLDSVIWGATCDSADKIDSVSLEPMRNGDFLMIENFGAYTIAGACDFNGINMTKPKTFYVK